MIKRVLSAALLTAALLTPLAVEAQTAQPPTARTVALVRVYVTDFARSERFYSEVFGLTSPQNYGGREHVFTLDPTGARLVLALTPTAHGNGSFALSVSDLDGVIAQTPGAGGAVVRAPGAPSGSGVRIGIVTDPDGAEIEVIQAAAPR